MKKIIYSLVIMIAAGSLFTSCIEQVEPVGLLDMRTAKAEYIRALKDLRAADAEYTRAKAAVEQANARYRDAETAFKNAQVENQNLLNDLQQLWNEAQAQENTRRAAEIAAEIEGIQMTMDSLAARHEISMVNMAKELAQAQESLRVVLRDIAIAAKSLSPNEKLAVVEAAAMVAVLTEEQAKALKEVNAAQKDLDSIKFNALVKGSTWADGYLEGLEEHYQDLIEVEQAKIAIAEVAKALVPLATAQLDEWQAVVDGYAKDSIAIAQEMAQQTYDSTAYINATVRPGIVKFNKAIAEFIEENWNEAGDFYTEPEDEDAPKDPSKMTLSQKKEAGYLIGASDSIPLPKLEREPKSGDEISSVSWAKYQYLLNGYDQDSPWSKIADEGEGDNENIKNILYFDEDTAKWGAVKNDGKDWILGAYDQDGKPVTYKEVTAQYGLKGAYSVLERDYVTSNYQQTTEEEKAAKKREIDSLAKLWTADRDTLMKGLAEYKFYKEAKAVKAEKDSLLIVAKAKKSTDSAAVITAAKALFVKIYELEHGSQTGGAINIWSVDDSTQLITLISNYAAQVENYLENPDTARYAAGANPLFFYFCHQTSTDVANIQDSVKFSALATGEKQAYWKYTTNYNVEPAVDHMGGTPIVRKQAFVNILEQLFDAGIPNTSGGDHICLTNIINKLHPTAEGYEHAYDLVKGNPNKWYIDDWDTAKPKLMSGVEDNEYKPKYVVDAENAVNRAATGVVMAEGKYWNVYDRFWNDPIEEEGVRSQENAKYDVNYLVDGKKQGDKYYKVYSLNTFKDYNDGKVAIYFYNADVVLTRGLKAILTAVDPACQDKGNNNYFTPVNINTSALLGAETDLYNWAYAKYELSLMDTDVTADLAAIKAWIEKVEEKFVEDKANETKTNQKYADDVDAYPGKYAKWEKKHAAYEKYIAAKKEFVGTHTEVIGGKDSVVLNDLYLKSPKYGKVNNPVRDTSFSLQNAANITTLFATNILGDYVGWSSKLGGQQLANAKEAFGEKPYEQIQEWKVARKVNEAKQATLSDLKVKAEAVFVEKAKVEGIGAVDSTSLKTMKAYWKNYVDEIDGKIKTAKEKIAGTGEGAQHVKGYADLLADAINGNITSEYLIKDAEIKLAAAEDKLEAITKMLEKAQANLDKIMEYIKSTDAEFVIPVTNDDVNTIVSTLSGFGINLTYMIDYYAAAWGIDIKPQN